ncbi:Rab1a [Hexamita inflata]|uniref:Rab1a n=1 Tax=Hexamita inflata TaxID=28002 RepID=A0ABP1ISZ2_9EUKA
MSQLQSVESDIKIVVLGDVSVGKTSILYRYISNSYYEQPSTITASFFKKKLHIPDFPTNLQLWDTAGQEKFQSITPMYYRNADIVLIVFAVDSPHSFERATVLVEEVRTKRDKCNIILIGNKTDLENVIKERAEEYSSVNGIKIFFVSALTGSGVKEAFQSTVEEVVRNKRSGGVQKLVKEEEEGVQKGCC